MGNESSTPVDEATRPTTLQARNIEAVARYIKEKDVKNIVVMTGAGISTSAGIPDFRSPDTGLYANLARLKLPYAEAVFDISYFRNNPYPFYTLAHELYPGKYRPTVTHSFISLLHKKGRLLKLFTQNIDCLEREAGVPGDMIVEAHGSFATQRCIECRTEYPDDKMREVVGKKEVPHCINKKCDGLVKPDIVFFGEALPESFFRNRSLPAKADLAIILGTSLTVQPFASLPSFVREDTPRVLINLEKVGGLGSRPDDVLMLGDCDAGVRKFADALGWRDELEELWETTNPTKGERKQQEVPKSRQESLDDEIEKLTTDIDNSLKLTGEANERMKAELQNNTPPNNAVPNPSSSPTDVLTTQVNTSNEESNLAHVFPHLKEEKRGKSSL
jgi:NAD-dependent histone deacetylase SIR2